ncbi:MAG: hypothetical protein HQM08_28500 [Candidatus Riflebacteria bacterium]|nr:hypothetical protein [Candidatus Riflebacteria bacterium]
MKNSLSENYRKIFTNFKELGILSRFKIKFKENSSPVLQGFAISQLILLPLPILTPQSSEFILGREVDLTKTVEEAKMLCTKSQNGCRCEKNVGVIFDRDIIPIFN